MSRGFSFRIKTIKQHNWAHIFSAHKYDNYSKQWLYFKDRNDANRLIRKVKRLVEENQILIK